MIVNIIVRYPSFLCIKFGGKISLYVVVLYRRHVVLYYQQKNLMQLYQKNFLK